MSPLGIAGYPQRRRQHGRRKVFRIVGALDFILAEAVMLRSKGSERCAKPMLALILRPQ
jgi:hypothetical protein